jgi:hypothetical protein
MVYLDFRLSGLYLEVEVEPRTVSRLLVTIQHTAWARLSASVEPSRCDEPLYTVPLATRSFTCRQATEWQSCQINNAELPRGLSHAEP